MSHPITIPEIRETIDEADDILLRALSARFRAIRHLSLIKKDINMQIESPSRETELKERWKKRADELGVPSPLALLILDFILVESKRIQSV